ncbi:MAG TPA: formate dehydrogenase subunit gamma [Marinobacterium sp.]|nr:formate dehydrogenase subunit gamma [Marinobacterium sp.]
MPLTAEQITRAVQLSIDKLIAKPGALLPILHDIQDTLGYIPPSAVPQIATALNQSNAEIHGVISFYHQFRTHPVGKHNVEICRAEACQAMGSRSLEAHAKRALGVDYHQTTTDGAIYLEPVYCLGNCACSPSVRIGDRVHARVTPERFDALMDELRTEKLEVLNG